MGSLPDQVGRRLIPLFSTLPAVLSALALCESVAAQDCAQINPLLLRGYSVTDIARRSGLPSAYVEACRQQLRDPRSGDPAGPPPYGAPGPAPLGAPGPAPHGAAGPAPHGAPGPAPHGAAGPPPSGAAGGFEPR